MKIGVEFFVAIALGIGIALILFAVSARGGSLPCAASPGGRDWHYRTKVPGYAGDVHDDKCWYDGPRMKPREELYWPAPDVVPMVVDRLPWEMENRWQGSGWDHKE